MHQQRTAFENIVGKGEIARKEQFLLFLQCFLLNQIIASPFVHILTLYLYLLLNWKSLKLVNDVTGTAFYRLTLNVSEFMDYEKT